MSNPRVTETQWRKFHEAPTGRRGTVNPVGCQ
jgi:hypothetical protein